MKNVYISNFLLDKLGSNVNTFDIGRPAVVLAGWNKLTLSISIIIAHMVLGLAC